MKEKLKGLWKILFGRTTIMVVLVLIQIILLFGGAAILGSKIIVANNIVGVISVVLLIYILNVQMNSSFKFMWIVIIVATPVIGVPFFFFTKIQPGTKYITERMAIETSEQRNWLLPDRSTEDKLIRESGGEYGLFKYLYEEGNAPVYDDCGIKYFPFGEDKFDELLKQLQGAKKFIFMEYFIIDKGQMWDEVLRILKEKAAAGVEVRLLYDGTNMLIKLPRNYPAELRSYGIDCRVFSPMKPVISTHQNNRDHRKIVVIDGHTAFTGGVNLADEYINRKNRFGVWKDSAIMVKGKAVNSFTLLFLQMWNVEDPDNEDYDRYMYREMPKDPALYNGGFIVPYGDSPLDSEDVGKKVYMDILNRANRYVHIMTPYLILDEEMTNALVFAAERGIDVKIIVPHHPDKKYAYYLATTYFEELIRGGVKLYEYMPGFVHAKSFVSDDIKAVVGTINLDFRSLYLHFECAAYIWKNPVVQEIEDDYQNTLEKCRRITLKDCRNTNILIKICGRALRLVAPLM